MNGIKNSDELIPGVIYRDTETILEDTSYLQFIKQDHDTIYFKYSSGSNCYMVDSNGFIQFLKSDCKFFHPHYENN